MKSRHVVIRITAAHGSTEPDRALEALRAAVGLVRSSEEHDVEIVLEGPASQLLAGENADARPMLAQLRAADVPWYVTVAEAMPEGAVLIDEKGLTELLEGAEVVLRY